METKLKNLTEKLEQSLKKLRIVVNAQPKIADRKFFEAASDYKRKRDEIIENGNLELNQIKEYDEEYHMLTIG